MHAPFTTSTTDAWQVPPALKAYLARIGAEVRNFRRYVVKQEYRDHYHYDKVVITASNDGTLELKDEHVAEYGPTETEIAAIAAEIKALVAEAKWPKSYPALNTDELKAMLPPDAVLFEFKDPAGHIIFVQQRVYKDGEKHDLAWSYWNDGHWRPMEPDTALPLCGLEKLREACVVYLHEGAKCALAMTDKWLAEHPWKEHLASPGAEHLGWPGGAPNPHRVDWEPIRKLPPHVRVVIVCDNDDGGNAAATKISRLIKRKCGAIQFGEDFPVNFDLAEPWPEKYYKVENGKKVYIGPRFLSCWMSTTWATRVVDLVRKKPVYDLRDEFRNEWLWTSTPIAFIHREHVDWLYTRDEFNAKVRPFSDVPDTAALLLKHHGISATTPAYEPILRSGRVVLEEQDGRGRMVINCYRPSNIKPTPYAEGADKPWHDYMEHLIPDKGDRHNAYRWVATLIARPDIHMLYGLLLISVMQGVGKGTLAEKILRPIIGVHNTAAPTESEIMNPNYTYWSSNKRLVTVHEIYEGESKKVYDKLKTIITEKTLRVLLKYLAAYEIRNWLHILACSNSMRALKLDNTDRRWLIPLVTELKRDLPYWQGLNAWLVGGGLGIICQWAHDFVTVPGNVVEEGEHAPDSARKREVIRAGMSDGERWVTELGEQLKAHKDNALVRLDHVRRWLGDKKAAWDQNKYGNDKLLEAPETIANRLREVGLKQSVNENNIPRQFKKDGDRFKVFANFDIDPKATWESLEKAGCCYLPAAVYEWPEPEASAQEQGGETTKESDGSDLL